MATNNEQNDSGWLNFKWSSDAKLWTLSGSYTDHEGKQWDLGYAKVGAPGLLPGLAVLAGQMSPTLNGKGVARQERQR